ncbi:hypothetical protein B0H17DRAFT_1335506 [Mycena rosella]|uniref:Uncharacterized protein n=1 Tax=Mycena rosella TaxID=1033263 RepID=A0AAD7CZJ1_MYCRO|nr:hypothetical protein B0H17DRAFT_1335506 [Mycena rosella]
MLPIDPTLLTVVRYDLDPAPRDALLAAQAETRRKEGTTPEELAAIFFKNVQDARCLAIDSNGQLCQGGPLMKPKTQGPSHGHQHIIVCSGWRQDFKEEYRTLSIPDHVDENLLAKLFAGKALTTDPSRDTGLCSRLVHPHIGLKQRFCPHPHIVDGKAALIVHNNTGHNHPMPPLSKVSLTTRETYRQCVKTAGSLGATVSKVYNAQSTKLLLKGKTPTAFAPALYNKRVKRDLVRAVKAEEYPNGLDVAGIFAIYLRSLTKPLPERYIHSYITTPDGGICILTCVPYLLKLLDDAGVIAFDGDTTYQRIEGEMNEWELTIYEKVVLRAATVVRAYINRASADFFEKMFDELQRVKISITGKPIPLKRFVRGGNLLVMNADMNAAQVLGVCRSVMKHNDPEPVHDFRAVVPEADYHRLLEFVHISSKQALDEFSAFVYGLNNKKISGSDWWAHKEMHEWIIPCLIRSQSRIPADIWDSTPSTTNTNEAQHHWSNLQTGIRLTPVEALESAHRVDKTVAEEIEMSRRTGILSNPNNEITHLMARNSQRQSTSVRKARESRELMDVSKQLQARLEEEAEKRRQSSALTKALKEELKAVKGTSGRKGKPGKSVVLSASSSGRVNCLDAYALDTGGQHTHCRYRLEQHRAD